MLYRVLAVWGIRQRYHGIHISATTQDLELGVERVATAECGGRAAEFWPLHE